MIILLWYSCPYLFVPYPWKYSSTTCPISYLQLLVKKYAMERLAEIYKNYCLNNLNGSMKSDGYDWIPGKILRCFYDKDFRYLAIVTSGL